MESLTTNITLAELCRKYNLKPNVFYGWKQKFIEGGKMALTGSGENIKASICCRSNSITLPRLVAQFQVKLLNFMESGHIKVDQMRKQYDFKIKGAKVFETCNEIARLSRPLQSRFRCLHLPRYT
jgi:hypothetical protein